jgi:hypothetical protein
MGDVPTTLPSSSGAWFGSRTYITKKDAEFVEAHARLLKARADQCEALGTLLDKRTELAAKIADLHNVLAEHQRVRDHERWQAERKRQQQRRQADYDDLTAVARNEAELDRAREAAVRAQRNLAERQDSAADLDRAAPPPVPESVSRQAADQQQARDVAVLDSQIELERERGNQAALMALLNLRARLVAR